MTRIPGDGPGRAGRGVLIAAIGVCAAMGLAGAAQAQRVALLIGNAGYRSAPLQNPPGDVRKIEAALLAVGFKVQRVLDADQKQMKAALRDFGNRAQGAELAFIYYSGHGTQSAGENYLIPVQANIEKESDLELEAVSANALMRQIAGAKPRAAIVVLDACRDNPYASATKSLSKGLGRMEAPTGTMIAFATSIGRTAADEGIYAEVLAEQIKTPNLELYDVFRNTAAEVVRRTHGGQEPRISEVSITDRIYLAGQAAAIPMAAAPIPPAVQAVRPAATTAAPGLIVAPAISAAIPAPTAVAGGSIGQMLIKERMTNKSRTVDVRPSRQVDDVTFFNSGDAVSADGQVLALQLANHVALFHEGTLWTLPLRSGATGTAKLRLVDIKGTAELTWRVAEAGNGGGRIEANVVVNPSDQTGAYFGGSRSGYWRATYKDGQRLPASTEYRTTVMGSAGNAQPEMGSTEFTPL